MSDPLSRVVPGERFRPRADTQNAIIDAINATRALSDQGNGSGGSGRSTLRPGQVLIRNDSGEDRDQFDVLFLDDVVIEPADNVQEWAERFAFSASATPGDDPKWVVLAEPIGDGRFGRAWLTGAFGCRVSGEGGWAAYDAASTTALKLGATGDAAVLWEEETETPEEDHYAVVMRSSSPHARLGCVTEDWTPNGTVPVRLANPEPEEGEESTLVDALAPGTSGDDTAGLQVLLIPLAAVDAAAVGASYAIIPRECAPSCEEAGS